MPDHSRHESLVRRMAARLGLDLDAETQKGHLPPEAFGDAVQACMGCTQVAACERWMAALAVPAPDAPDYCRNSDRFAALKRRS